MTNLNEEITETQETVGTHEQDNVEEIIDEGVAESSGNAAEKETATVTLTQEEFNETIRKRLERERKKFADYEELKKKSEAHDEAMRQAEREKMTEVERLEADLKEAAEELEKYRTESEQTRKEAAELRIRTEFEIKAREAGIKYVEDAYKLTVVGNEGVTVEGGKVSGIDEIIKDIAENKPFLLNPAQPIGQPLAQRELPKKTNEDQLKAAAERARQEGTPEARAEYSRLKRELGLA